MCIDICCMVLEDGRRADKCKVLKQERRNIMYSLKDNGVISEVVCGNNFEYVLEDNSSFVMTDYKVLQSQTNDVFVQCMKMTRNGKIDLCYVTKGFRPMTSMFGNITADTLISIAINLFASVIEVRNNGFLACQCIELSWDKIFIEPSTLKVRLVYLPLSVNMFNSYAEFENELRSKVIILINRVNAEKNKVLNQLIQDLRDNALSIEVIYRKLVDGRDSCETVKDENGVSELTNRSNEVLRMVALNAPEYFEIVIDCESLVIGKNKEMVDRVIPYNNAISRKHCRIICVNGAFFITDEGSMNGTFVNNENVVQGQCYHISKGDIVRLADSEFQIM